MKWTARLPAEKGSAVMNLLAGFIGYSAFVVSMLVIGGVGYYFADDLERWAKQKLRNEQHRGE